LIVGLIVGLIAGLIAKNFHPFIRV